MSFRHLLFIKRLHRDHILQTLRELNMNECKSCNGTGFTVVFVGNAPIVVECQECNGYSDHEDVAK